MRLEQDKDQVIDLDEESTIYRYSEDRLNKTQKKKKKNPFRSALIISGYIVALILVMWVVALINTWITDKLENSAKELAVSAGAELLPEDQQVTLTQAELDDMLAKAAEDAAAESDAKVAEVIAQTELEKEQAAQEARKAVLDGIKAGLETGDDTMVEVLRPFYPDDIVVVSSGKFNFVPINKELQMNSYDEANLNILESGEYQYMDGETIASHKGIDVSKFQGKIDWSEVAKDGVEFAFVRVANRGYGTGKLVEDDTFETNIKGEEEAELVIKKLEALAVKCPIVFDVEKTADASGRMNQLSVEERTNLTKRFCQIVEEAGYKPIIYHNVEMGALMIDVSELEEYDKWLAYYNDDMYYPYEYKIWQYSDKGKVNGIKGNVDMNISFTKFWE